MTRTEYVGQLLINLLVIWKGDYAKRIPFWMIIFGAFAAGAPWYAPIIYELVSKSTGSSIPEEASDFGLLILLGGYVLHLNNLWIDGRLIIRRNGDVEQEKRKAITTTSLRQIFYQIDLITYDEFIDYGRKLAYYDKYSYSFFGFEAALKSAECVIHDPELNAKLNDVYNVWEHLESFGASNWFRDTAGPNLKRFPKFGEYTDEAEWEDKKDSWLKGIEEFSQQFEELRQIVIKNYPEVDIASLSQFARNQINNLLSE